MSRSFFYTLQGGDKLLQILRSYPDTIRKAISEEFLSTGLDIRTKAVQRAQDRIPGEFDHMSPSRRENAEEDINNVARSISFNKINELTFEVISGAATSAYFEFGTGRYVFNGETWVDADLRDYARTFYVDGKGITKPHPFLFNTFYEERVKLINTIKEKLGAK